MNQNKKDHDNFIIGNLKIAPDVNDALLHGNPVVALESTIISHGLTNEQLERLAKLGSKAQKTARRDISHVVATGGNGATTVSATMFFASKVRTRAMTIKSISVSHYGLGNQWRKDETNMLCDLLPRLAQDSKPTRFNNLMPSLILFIVANSFKQPHLQSMFLLTFFFLLTL